MKKKEKVKVVLEENLFGSGGVYSVEYKGKYTTMEYHSKFHSFSILDDDHNFNFEDEKIIKREIMIYDTFLK